eukprot:4810531-Prymnesium_polylepis.1
MSSTPRAQRPAQRHRTASRALCPNAGHAGRSNWGTRPNAGHSARSNWGTRPNAGHSARSNWGGFAQTRGTLSGANRYALLC